MKKYLVFALVVLLIGALATGVLAGNVGRLMLYEKDPGDWDNYPLPDGASGALRYGLQGPHFSFSFHGNGLQADTEYSLIYYGDPWPGDNPGAFLGSKTTNKKGDINFGGSVELNMDLPGVGDANSGAKIWLVLSDDYDADNQMMTAWNPTEYLFEDNLIIYDDTQI